MRAPGLKRENKLKEEKKKRLPKEQKKTVEATTNEASPRGESVTMSLFPVFRCKDITSTSKYREKQLKMSRWSGSVIDQEKEQQQHGCLPGT
ncbi:hypothetical protein HNY73_006413 [Argiope bruennichi]|uniref:Uncharacterized protein n=1 Tax=Argiope bruennichi TaxID=94029 RepID=A0A8T0FMX4_ARGBR|nr:hypothetical protein HNY73_006413 [Argiope bruennichi]